MPISVVQACTFYTYYSGTDCDGYNTHYFRYVGTPTTGAVVKITGDICVENWVVDSTYTTNDVLEQFIQCNDCQPLCYVYDYQTFGYATWTDCDGTSQNVYLNFGDEVCARINEVGPNFIYSGIQCTSP